MEVADKIILSATLYQLTYRPEKKLEATSGFEPLNRGFADPCLNHLATSPRSDSGAEDGIRTRDLLLGKEAFYR